MSNVFLCKKCQRPTRVLESRYTKINDEAKTAIRRRRVCEDKNCAERFTTYEVEERVITGGREAKARLARMRKALLGKL